MKIRKSKVGMLAMAVISVSALAACQSPSGSSGSRNAEFNCMAGTVGGAVIGGLLGSTIGGGRGRTAATAVGIGAGGYLGNSMGCK